VREPRPLRSRAPGTASAFYHDGMSAESPNDPDLSVAIIRGGGVGGFLTRTAVSADSLPAEAASGLRRRVRSVSVDAASAQAARPSGRHPDELLYQVVIDDAGERTTLELAESQLPDSVRDLAEYVDTRPERTLEIEPPAGP